MASLSVFGSNGTDLGQFQYPHGIAVSSKGEVAVIDTCNHRVQLFNSDGQFLRAFGSQGVKDDFMNFPYSATYDKQDNIIVTDSDNHRMLVFSSAGELIRVFGDENLRNPWGVCTNSDGNIAVCSGGEKGEVQVYSPEGSLVMQFSDPSTTSRPSYVAYSHERYFVSYSDDQCVKAFDSQGRLLFNIGEPGIADAQFNRPRGLAVDEHKQLLVCDGWNNRIQVFSQEGKFLSKFGSRGKGAGQLTFPHDLSIGQDGRIFVSELKGERVQVFQGLDNQA
ncbi:hypothetical protein OS493_017831 [Desmophyllum pertusum]|uniref:Uncharacterized protein n=1 Tax=Desmophyllum pertusum TaxID=174260 RepID=A0A9X0CYR7_9CNID|nr:hypothetical protein OS493_017831 [Desmophyllum pertusum]